MKSLFFSVLISVAIVAGASVAYGQCDRSTASPIRCGYYDEGYQDGASDARGRQGNDYRRYRNKFENQYENFYRDGYDAGYRSIGYNPGPFPPGTGGSGSSASWAGRVDNRANIILRGNTITVEDLTGSGLQTTYQNVNGRIPNRSVTVSANKVAGRGSVSVIQQPDRSNDFTAIVQISDPRSGADDYRVDINWEGRGNGGGRGRDEQYQPGRVVWKGRVDQTADITINGSTVETQTVEGSPVNGNDFTISGHLAYRPGTVNVRKIRGRGSVTIVQQPSSQNDFTAVIQVIDPNGGADNYEVEITW